MTAPGKRRGRPAVWVGEAERQRQYRTRRAEKLALVDALLDAVRNARWEDAALHRQIQEGDDAAVLAALTEYYRQRHWCAPRPRVAPVGDPPSPSKPSPEPTGGGKPAD